MLPFYVADNAPMPVRSTPDRDPPGCNVHRMRLQLKLSQRALADKCKPALDHTTIRRLELNLGYTQDTLERVAKALGVDVPTLFLPTELQDWPTLSREARERVSLAIQDAAVAARYRAR